MSSLFWSSPDGCVGGPGFFRYLASFDDIPESEFYDDVDDPILFVPDSLDDVMEVNDEVITHMGSCCLS